MDLWFLPAPIPLGRIGGPAAGDDGRVFASDGCGDDPHPHRAGSDCRALASAATVRAVPGSWSGIRKARWAVAAGKPVPTDAFEASAACWARQCGCVGRATAGQGLVERNNDYYERSFLPDAPSPHRATSTPRSVSGSPPARTCAITGSWAASRSCAGQRQGGDVAAAAGEPGRRVAAPPPAQGPLRAPGHQRSLVIHAWWSTRGGRCGPAVRAGVRRRQLVADHDRCWAAIRPSLTPPMPRLRWHCDCRRPRPQPSVDPLAVEVRRPVRLRSGVRPDDGRWPDAYRQAHRLVVGISPPRSLSLTAP